MIRLTRFFYIHWLVLPLAVLAYLTHSLHTLAMAYAIVMVHELFHLFAALLLGERISSVIIMPFGITLRLAARVIRSGAKEICIALAGPLANGLMLFISFFLQKSGGLNSASLWLFDRVNQTTLLLNLLPCLPLDGGRVVKALLTRWLGYISAVSVMRRVSRVVTVLLFLCGVGLLLITGLNISLLMIAAFLTLYMTEEKRENEYVIMQELLDVKKKLTKRGMMPTRTIVATASLPARRLIRQLCYDAYHVVHVVNDRHEVMGMVTEAQIVAAIQQEGWHLTLGDVLRGSLTVISPGQQQ